MSSLRLQLLKETGWTCIYCGHPLTKETLTIDHIIPRTRWGANADYNKVASCAECNVQKDAMTVSSYVRTFKMRKYSAFENRVMSLYYQHLLPEVKKNLLMDRRTGWLPFFLRPYCLSRVIMRRKDRYVRRK